MNVNGVSIGASGGVDSEYLRIMRELRSLGIEPTGDKSADKAKLQRVQQSQSVISEQPERSVQSNKTFEEAISEVISLYPNNQINPTAMMGATQVAEMNKFRLWGTV